MTHLRALPPPAALGPLSRAERARTRARTQRGPAGAQAEGRAPPDRAVSGLAGEPQSGFNELMNIYKHACRPAYEGALGGLNGLACGEPSSAAGATAPIAWADGIIGDRLNLLTLTREGGVQHGGFLSGARRKWGELSPQARRVLDEGNLHGVSTDTSPLQ